MHSAKTGIYMPAGWMQTLANGEQEKNNETLSKTKELFQKHSKRQRWGAVGSTENIIAYLGSKVKKWEAYPQAPVEKTNT